ncbi:MAG: hypothetical protein ACNA8W_07660 [Bradymonadaceae bacterium]
MIHHGWKSMGAVACSMLLFGCAGALDDEAALDVDPTSEFEAETPEAPGPTTESPAVPTEEVSEPACAEQDVFWHEGFEGERISLSTVRGSLLTTESGWALSGLAVHHGLLFGEFDYTVELEAEGVARVLFFYEDEDNYSALQLLDDELQLLDVRAGNASVLVDTPLPAVSTQPFELAVTYEAGQLRASVSGAELSFEVGAERSGRVGVSTAGTVVLHQARVLVSGCDNKAPSVPRGLNATTFGHEDVFLSWQPSTDDTGVVGYSIYRDGERIDEGLQGSSGLGLLPRLQHPWSDGGGARPQCPRS